MAAVLRSAAPCAALSSRRSASSRVVAAAPSRRVVASRRGAVSCRAHCGVRNGSCERTETFLFRRALKRSNPQASTSQGRGLNQTISRSEQEHRNLLLDAERGTRDPKSRAESSSKVGQRRISFASRFRSLAAWPQQQASHAKPRPSPPFHQQTPTNSPRSSAPLPRTSRPRPSSTRSSRP